KIIQHGADGGHEPDSADDTKHHLPFTCRPPFREVDLSPVNQGDDAEPGNNDEYFFPPSNDVDGNKHEGGDEDLPDGSHQSSSSGQVRHCRGLSRTSD